MQQGFPPSFQDYSLRFFHIGKKPFEILQSHVLPGKGRVSFPAAHPALQGASGGELNLPGRKSLPWTPPEKIFPELFHHRLRNP
jgi:hypothetical protein